ncbi:MAG TPA: phosphoenolpyruvate-utilizing N-terminal domain-containing protein, partial [Acidimicrobiia bacterium]|nr:phosphoenolpyruvate-utilizing N-terminal domain-containing protein [Acidimicrobiia bacterium]
MNATSTHLAGIGVSPGIASGPVEWLAPPPVVPNDLAPTGDPETEARVAGEAVAATADDLDARSSSAVGPAADVLAAQAMMA